MNKVISKIVPDFDEGDEPEYVELLEEPLFFNDEIKKVIVRAENNGVKFYKVTFYLNDNFWKIMYYKNSKLHREACLGPAFISYSRSEPGKLISEIYFKDGKKHRLLKDGPAEISYSKNRKGKSRKSEKYYLDDELIKEEF